MTLKHVWSAFLCAAVLGLPACGNDDDRIEPELMKITRIECREEGSSNSWSMQIEYEAARDNLYKTTFKSVIDGVEKSYSDLYVYNNNTITVTRIVGTDPDINRTYVCSGDVITREQTGSGSSSAAGSEYSYQYVGRELTSMTQTIQGIPPVVFNYTWDATGNMTELVYGNNKVRFVYNNVTEQPANFPFKAMKSADLTDKSLLDPVNLLFSATSRYLPGSAEEIEVGIGEQVGNNKVVKTYSFVYNRLGKYITGMTLTVKNGSGTAETYIYSFMYDYTPQAR